MNCKTDGSVEDMIKELSRSSLDRCDWEIIYELCVRSYYTQYNPFKESCICKCIQEKITEKIEETMALFSEE